MARRQPTRCAAGEAEAARSRITDRAVRGMSGSSQAAGLLHNYTECLACRANGSPHHRAPLYPAALCFRQAAWRVSACAQIWAICTACRVAERTHVENAHPACLLGSQRPAKRQHRCNQSVSPGFSQRVHTARSGDRGQFHLGEERRTADRCPCWGSTGTASGWRLSSP